MVPVCLLIIGFDDLGGFFPNLSNAGIVWHRADLLTARDLDPRASQADAGRSRKSVLSLSPCMFFNMLSLLEELFP